MQPIGEAPANDDTRARDKAGRAGEANVGSAERHRSEEGSSAPRRTVLVTGAGGNLAPHVIRHFTQEGWSVALVDRGRNADALRREFPDAQLLIADLAEPDAAARAIGEIEKEHGSIDALAHLAGGFAMTPATSNETALMDRMLAANVRSLEGAVRAVLPGMLRRKRGAVLGIAARQALEGGRNVTAYAAAKGAVLGYLRALAVEVGPAGVGVAAVVPMGTIDTPENRDAMPKADPNGWIDPDEMAQALLYLASRSPRGRVHELRLYAVPIAP